MNTSIRVVSRELAGPTAQAISSSQTRTHQSLLVLNSPGFTLTLLHSILSRRCSKQRASSRSCRTTKRCPCICRSISERTASSSPEKAKLRMSSLLFLVLPRSRQLSIDRNHTGTGDQVLFRFLLDCFCALAFLLALELLLLLSSNSGANTAATSVEASISGSGVFLSANGGRGNALYINSIAISIGLQIQPSPPLHEPENGLKCESGVEALFCDCNVIFSVAVDLEEVRYDCQCLSTKSPLAIL